jgi:hypothetical protein
MNPHQKPQEDVVGLPFRLLASRGRFPSGGAVPYDVTSELIQQAYEAGRRDMREAAGKVFIDWIGEGYEPPKDKTTQCPHGQFGWEDCIACYDEALLGKIETWLALPTEPLGGQV